MNAGIITYENLQELFGGRSPANVAVRLKEQEIEYKLGLRGRPFTTVDALNKALGIISHGQHTLESKNPKREVEIL